MALRRRKQAVYEKVRRAVQRYEDTGGAGVTTWHSFSAGANYDAGNLGFGALVGLDEHLFEPGQGFAEHAHRGVEILSWVLEGTLRHEGSDGTVELVEPGPLLWQSTGSGVRHSERNPSSTDALRFVQITLLGGAGAPATRLVDPPVLVPGLGLLEVLTGRTELEVGLGYVHVMKGRFDIVAEPLGPGDAIELTRTATLDGSGQALLWTAGGRTPPDSSSLESGA